VYAAAHEQVAGQRAGHRVLDHLVDLQLVVARAGLEEEVVRQVLDQIARREDVVPVPRPPVGVLRQRALSTREEVVRVPDPLHGGQRVLGHERAGAPVGGRRGAGQHRVDRGRDELDVAELLGSDVGDQVVERARALTPAEIERLERVVQERGHLAEASAHELLNGRGAGRIRVGRRRQLDRDPVVAKNHVTPSSR
jgi:hypothetical protein